MFVMNHFQCKSIETMNAIRSWTTCTKNTFEWENGENQSHTNTHTHKQTRVISCVLIVILQWRFISNGTEFITRTISLKFSLLQNRFVWYFHEANSTKGGRESPPAQICNYKFNVNATVFTTWSNAHLRATQRHNKLEKRKLNRQPNRRLFARSSRI